MSSLQLLTKIPHKFKLLVYGYNRNSIRINMPTVLNNIILLFYYDKDDWLCEMNNIKIKSIYIIHNSIIVRGYHTLRNKINDNDYQWKFQIIKKYMQCEYFYHIGFGLHDQEKLQIVHDKKNLDEIFNITSELMSKSYYFSFTNNQIANNDIITLTLQCNNKQVILAKNGLVHELKRIHTIKQFSAGFAYTIYVPIDEQQLVPFQIKLISSGYTY